MRKDYTIYVKVWNLTCKQKMNFRQQFITCKKKHERDIPKHAIRYLPKQYMAKDS